MKTTTTNWLISVSLLFGYACTEGPHLPMATGVFSVRGQVIGTTVPENTGAVIYWEAEFARGNGYVFGAGETLGSEFVVSVPSAPTMDQPNGPLIAPNKGYAVGRIFAAHQPVPVEGPGYPADLVFEGFTPDHAIIYRIDNINGPAWLSSFPVGFSCAKCVDTGGSFSDYWVPTPCGDVAIWTAQDTSSFPLCGW